MGSYRIKLIFFLLTILTTLPVLIFASTVIPDNSTVGGTTNYSVTFALAPADNLPNNGTITITFNDPNFTLPSTMIASSSDIDGGIVPATPSGLSVTFTRDGTGTALIGGNSYTIRFGTVDNPTSPGSYNLTVTTSGGTSDPTSPSFNIVVGSISQIRIEDAAGGSGSEITMISTDTDDDSQQIFAIARDQFGNFVSDVSVTWSVTGGIGSVGGGWYEHDFNINSTGYGSCLC